MKNHSISVQSIPDPVWVAHKPAIVPPFMVTPKRGKHTDRLLQHTQKMKAERVNPEAVRTQST